MRVFELSRLAADDRPATPHRAQTFPVGRRLQLVRAVRSREHAPVREFDERHERWVDLLDRRGEARESVRRGQVVCDARLRARRYRQREVEGPAPHDPHARLPLAAAEELEAREVGPLYLGREPLHVLRGERLGEQLLRERRLAEEARRLLPLALARDVRVVAATVCEDGELVRALVVITSKPAPSLIVRARQVVERRGTKLGVSREEGDNLKRVLVRDDAEASAPRVAVAVRLDQVPPKAHLRFQGRSHRVLYVNAPRSLARVEDEARVLVRVAVEASRRRRVVRVEAAARERSRRARDDAVQESAVFQESELIADARDARGDAEVVLRQVDDTLRLRVVEGRHVEELSPFGALVFAERLPHGVRSEVAPEVAQGEGAIELREARAAETVL